MPSPFKYDEEEYEEAGEGEANGANRKKAKKKKVRHLFVDISGSIDTTFSNIGRKTGMLFCCCYLSVFTALPSF